MCYVHGPDYTLLPHSVTKSVLQSTKFEVVVPPTVNNIIHSVNQTQSQESKLGNEVEIMSVLESMDTSTIQAGISFQEWEKNLNSFRNTQHKHVIIHQTLIWSSAPIILILACIVVIYKRKYIQRYFKSKSRPVTVQVLHKVREPNELLPMLELPKESVVLEKHKASAPNVYSPVF